LLKIRLTSPLPFSLDSLLFASNTEQPVQQVTSISSQPAEITTVNPILIVYLLVATVLFLRFLLNLIRLIRLLKTSTKIAQSGHTLVLIETETLPYSFLKYIVVNAEAYRSGTIEPELLQHEHAHVRQKHSLDIILIELTRIVIWFNPVVWLLGKAVQLNHEYLADEAVLESREITTYQNILLNVVFRNHSTYLASNFAYSCTKNRLIMMKKNPSGSDSLRKLLTLPLIAFLGMLVVQAQTTTETPVQTEKKVVKTTVKYTKPAVTQTPVAKKTIKFTKPVMATSPAVKKVVKFTPPVMDTEEKPKTPVQVDVKDVPPPPPTLSNVKIVVTDIPNTQSGTTTSSTPTIIEVSDVPPAPPTDVTKLKSVTP
jgi:bla regulator protein blaR1